MNRNELIAKHFGLFITLKTKQKLNGLLDEHEANRPLYPELVSENERLIGLLEKAFRDYDPNKTFKKFCIDNNIKTDKQ